MSGAELCFDVVTNGESAWGDPKVRMRLAHALTRALAYGASVELVQESNETATAPELPLNDMQRLVEQS